MSGKIIGESRNRLLACMGSDDRALLGRSLEPVALKVRQRLELIDRQIGKIYFIERGLGSVAAIAGHRCAEVAVIGREGMTGLAAVLGAERSAYETVMLVEGEGQCIAANDLRRAWQKAALFQRSSVAMPSFSPSRPGTPPWPTPERASWSDWLDGFLWRRTAPTATICRSRTRLSP
jgi:hypothetical protein